MASDASMPEILEELKAILAAADLETLTERNVRDLLVDKFGAVANYSEIKALISVWFHHFVSGSLLLLLIEHCGLGRS